MAVSGGVVAIFTHLPHRSIYMLVVYMYGYLSASGVPAASHVE